MQKIIELCYLKIKPLERDKKSPTIDVFLHSRRAMGASAGRILRRVEREDGD